MSFGRVSFCSKHALLAGIMVSFTILAAFCFVFSQFPSLVILKTFDSGWISDLGPPSTLEIPHRRSFLSSKREALVGSPEGLDIDAPEVPRLMPPPIQTEEDLREHPVSSANPSSKSIPNPALPGTASPIDESIRTRLGQAGWTILHTIALEFPTQPTLRYRRSLEAWLHLFPDVYPCQECAIEMRELFATYPPQTASGEEFGAWVCFVHNEVNRRLNKPILDCARWKDVWGQAKKSGCSSCRLR